MCQEAMRGGSPLQLDFQGELKHIVSSCGFEQDGTLFQSCFDAHLCDLKRYVAMAMFATDSAVRAEDPSASAVQADDNSDGDGELAAERADSSSCQKLIVNQPWYDLEAEVVRAKRKLAKDSEKLENVFKSLLSYCHDGQPEALAC